MANIFTIQSINEQRPHVPEPAGRAGGRGLGPFPCTTDDDVRLAAKNFFNIRRPNTQLTNVWSTRDANRGPPLGTYKPLFAGRLLTLQS